MYTERKITFVILGRLLYPRRTLKSWNVESHIQEEQTYYKGKSQYGHSSQEQSYDVCDGLVSNRNGKVPFAMIGAARFLKSKPVSM